MTESVSASYFDGKVSRAHQVTLTVCDGIATIRGDTERAAPLASLHVSERTKHSARRVSYADGAYLEIQDKVAFAALLQDSGHVDSFVVRMQQSWRHALLAALAIIVLLVAGYLYALPKLSKVIANALPIKVERSAGNGALVFLDQHVFAPSELPATRQDAIRARFRALSPPKSDAPPYKIVFRSSKIGANAFALPSGDIVVTDAMVKLMETDALLMPILAHELGHLHEHHLMQRIVQDSAIGALSTLLFGDVSAVVANIPTLLLDLRYSRDAEREADDYAIAMMQKNSIPLSVMVSGFQKMQTVSTDPAPYLASHPSTAERIARIRQAADGAETGIEAGAK